MPEGLHHDVRRFLGCSAAQRIFDLTRQARLVKGLEQIADWVDFIRFQRVLAEGRNEDDGDARMDLPDSSGQLQAVHPRHIDVQQRQIRRMPFQPFQCILATGKALHLVQQPQFLTRRDNMIQDLCFVVNTNRVHGRSFPRGIRMVIQVPLPSSLSMVMVPPHSFCSRSRTFWMPI